MMEFRGALFTAFANAKPGTFLGAIGPNGHMVVAAFVRFYAQTKIVISYQW